MKNSEPRITTALTFGGKVTTVRASWGTATVDAYPGHVVLSWTMNALTARRWSKALRETLLSFPDSSDAYIPAPVLRDVTPFLRMPEM